MVCHQHDAEYIVIIVYYLEDSLEKIKMDIFSRFFGGGVVGSDFDPCLNAGTWNQQRKEG